MGLIFYDLTIDNRCCPDAGAILQSGDGEFVRKSGSHFSGSTSDPSNNAVIGNENDQVPKGRSVDALAHTGDEGRDTLR